MKIFLLYFVCIFYAGCTSSSDQKKNSETAPSGKSRIKEDATSVINKFFKELSSGNDKNAITRMLSSNKNFILEDSAESEIEESLKLYADVTI